MRNIFGGRCVTIAPLAALFALLLWPSGIACGQSGVMEPVYVPPPILPPESDPPKVALEVRPPAVPPRPVRPAPFRFPERADGLHPPAGGLRQELAEYDRRLGLDDTESIVSTLREVAMDDWVTGEAMFEIIVDRSGAFRLARVVTASRDTAGWRRLAERLRQSPCPGIRLPPLAVGAWALLSVRIENERPAGPGRWRSPSVMLVFDPSNIAAPVVRTVRPQVLSEVWF